MNNLKQDLQKIVDAGLDANSTIIAQTALSSLSYLKELAIENEISIEEISVEHIIDAINKHKTNN